MNESLGSPGRALLGRGAAGSAGSRSRAPCSSRPASRCSSSGAAGSRPACRACSRPSSRWSWRGRSATWARTRRLYGSLQEDRARRLEAEREERAHAAVAGRARADRAGAARRRHAPRERDRDPGRRGLAGARPASRRTPGRRSRRSTRAAGEALADMRRMLGILGERRTATTRAPATPRTARPDARSGSPRRARSSRSAPPAHRWSSSVDGRAAAARRGRRAVGLPHRPGGADERPQARATAPARGWSSATSRAPSRSSSTDEGGTGRRDLGEPRPRGTRAHRHARASDAVRRHARGRARRRRGFRVAARLPSRHGRRAPDDASASCSSTTSSWSGPGFRMILADEPDIEVVGEAPDGRAGARPRPGACGRTSW